jgi:hypothetical protein
MRDTDLLDVTFLAAVSGLENTLLDDLKKRFSQKLSLELRPLQKRRSDIPFIFLVSLKIAGRRPSGITPAALEMLVRYCPERASAGIRDLALKLANKCPNVEKITSDVLIASEPDMEKARFSNDDSNLLKIVW